MERKRQKVRRKVLTEYDFPPLAVNMNARPQETRPRKNGVKPFRPQTEAQAVYAEAIETSTYTFGIGPAGTGKTFVAACKACEHLTSDHTGKTKVILTRPAIEAAGEKLGFLPGELHEKFGPYMKPLMRILIERLGEGFVSCAIKNERIQMVPLAFMRGEAQPLSSVIQTPDGPKRMGDVTVGSYVLGADGKATQVTGVYPKGVRKVYRVTFNDGVSTLACGNHLWNTQTRSEKKHSKGFTTKTTEEIIASGVRVAHQRNHEVPVLSGPAEFRSTAYLPLDPYLLGVLLGDGNMHELCSATFTTVDDELVELVRAALPEGTRLSQRADITFALVSDASESRVKGALRGLGLTGRTSCDKFIPASYLNARPEHRLALLQGLMDTDGCVWAQAGRSPRLQFYTVSPQLAEGVSHVVRSLGGTASTRVRKYDNEKRTVKAKSDGLVVEVCLPEDVQPFRLTRKKTKASGRRRVFRFIESIELVGEEECQCIKVAAADELYLTDDFIVTHNTFNDALIIADEMQNATREQMKMLLTRIGEGSRMVIDGDPAQTDIGDSSGLLDAVYRLRHLGSVSLVTFSKYDIVRHSIIQEVIEAFESEPHPALLS